MKTITLALGSLLLGMTAACFAQDKNVAASGGGGTQLSASEKEDVGDIHPEAEQNTFLKHLRGDLQVRGDYVTNAKLLGDHSSSDFITFPTAEAGYNTPLGHGFTLDLVARSESAIYSEYDNRSFWGFSGSGFLDWRYKPNAPRIFAGVEPYYYSAWESGRRLSEAMVFSTGIDHSYVFNKNRTLLTIGYKFSEHFAAPSLDDRDVHRVILGITHEFKPRFYGQLFYQYQFSDYTNESRRDSRNIVGTNFIYEFTAHLYGSAGADYIDNSSTQRLAKYQDFTAHAGLTLQF